jgi:hypothetical protein
MEQQQRKRITNAMRVGAVALTAIAALGACDIFPSFGGEPTTVTAELSGSISEDMTLESGNLYSVTDDVSVSAALTIQEDVYLQFASDTRLLIGSDGRIDAQGTESDPIVMRGAEEVAGYWRGIEIHSSDITNTLSYVNIMHTGSAELNSDAKTAIMVEGFAAGVVAIENVTVSDATGYGVVLQNGGTLQSFSGNVFESVDGFPVRVHVSQVHKLDGTNIYDGTNTDNRVEVEGGTIEEAVTWPAAGSGVHYFVNDDVGVSAELTVAAGAVLEFASAVKLNIHSSGGIIADASGGDTIVFTGAVEQAGYWIGIELNSAAVTNLMDNVEISYAGHTTAFSGGEQANMLLDGFNGAQLTLQNSTISHGPAHGVYVENGATFTNGGGNTFTSIGDDNGGTYQHVLNEN